MEIRGRPAERRSAAAARVKRGLSWKAWAADLDEHLERIYQLMWPSLMILGGGVSKSADGVPRLTVPCPVVPAELSTTALSAPVTVNDGLVTGDLDAAGDQGDQQALAVPSTTALSAPVTVNDGLVTGDLDAAGDQGDLQALAVPSTTALSAPVTVNDGLVTGDLDAAGDQGDLQALAVPSTTALSAPVTVNDGLVTGDLDAAGDQGDQQVLAVTSTTALSAPLAVNAAAAAVAPPAFVQVNAAVPQTNQSTVPVTYTNAQVAGDTNILAIGWNNATSNITSVTDSAGNAYQLAVPTFRGNGVSQAIYYAKNIKAAPAGTNTVTTTFNTATPFVDIRALEYSGLDPVNPFEVGASAAGAGTTANSGTVSTTAANALIFGAGMTTGSFGAATRAVHHPHHHQPRRRHRPRPHRHHHRGLQRHRTAERLGLLGDAGRDV